MSATELKSAIRAVIRRAMRQGFVRAADVREELKHAGLPPRMWKDVVTQARRELAYRDGLYWYVPPDPSVAAEHRQLAAVGRAVRRLVRVHRQSADQDERRREGRVDFIQPVAVQAEDGRTFTLLSRDLSPTGIRLIGARSFLGQKVRIAIPSGDGGEPVRFLMRVLWTCTVGDQLFENGGTFVELLAEAAAPPVVAGGNGILVH